MSFFTDNQHIAPVDTVRRISSKMLATSLDIAKRNISINSGAHPRRFAEGVAVSGPETYAGTSLLAAGLVFDEEVPLVFEHDEYAALGIIRRAYAHAGAVHFTAEVMNGPNVRRNLPRVDDIWAQLKAGVDPGVSVWFAPIARSKADGGVIEKWRLLEISLCAQGADPYARLTKIYERRGVGVVHIDSKKSEPRVFWSATA